MVKFATSVLVAAALAATVSAGPLRLTEADFDLRGFDESMNLDARDVEMIELLGRELADNEEFTARDLAELEVRTPGFKSFFKKAFRKVRGFLPFKRDEEGSLVEVASRDVNEELDAREFVDSELEARDFEVEEIEAREVEELLEMFERALDSEDEMFERDFEVDELD